MQANNSVIDPTCFAEVPVHMQQLLLELPALGVRLQAAAEHHHQTSACRMRSFCDTPTRQKRVWAPPLGRLLCATQLLLSPQPRVTPPSPLGTTTLCTHLLHLLPQLCQLPVQLCLLLRVNRARH